MKIFSSVIILFTLSSSLLSQPGNEGELDETEIAQLTDRLHKKVLLDDSQRSSIENILANYSAELTNLNSSTSSFSSKQELFQSTNAEIELILNTKQKMKYDIIKDDWWNSVRAETND